MADSKRIRELEEEVVRLKAELAAATSTKAPGGKRNRADDSVTEAVDSKRQRNSNSSSGVSNVQIQQRSFKKIHTYD